MLEVNNHRLYYVTIIILTVSVTSHSLAVVIWCDSRQNYTDEQKFVKTNLGHLKEKKRDLILQNILRQQFTEKRNKLMAKKLLLYKRHSLLRFTLKYGRKMNPLCQSIVLFII